MLDTSILKLSKGRPERTSYFPAYDVVLEEFLCSSRVHHRPRIRSPWRWCRSHWLGEDVV